MDYVLHISFLSISEEESSQLLVDMWEKSDVIMCAEGHISIDFTEARVNLFPNLCLNLRYHLKMLLKYPKWLI